MPSRTTTQSAARFGRIALVYAIGRNELGWINITRLLRLAGAPDDPKIQRRVALALQHLAHHGLVDVQVTRHRARYRRTVRGAALGRRMLLDRRVSFQRALGP
jgi:hypothetical protein